MRPTGSSLWSQCPLLASRAGAPRCCQSYRWPPGRRLASLTSAINRGIGKGRAQRREQGEEDSRRRRRSYDGEGDGGHNDEPPAPAVNPDLLYTRAGRPSRGGSWGKDERASGIRQPPRYSAADSQFLYGLYVVEAALRARRRTLHHLYLAPLADRRRPGQLLFLQELARSLGTPVTRLKEEQTRSLDMWAANHSHNGVVLEASPLTSLRVSSLARMHHHRDPLGATLDLPNPTPGPPTNIGRGHFAHPLSRNHSRFPLVVLIAGVRDPVNNGSIMRCAAFFGADAVAMLDHHTAPITPVVSKASGGAAEWMPLLSVTSLKGFLTESMANGWRVYASVPPPAEMDGSNATARNGRERPTLEAKFVHLDALRDRLRREPSILLLGSESDGISDRLLSVVDYLITVNGDPSRPRLLDSLNVSVAAAMIMRAFLPHDEAMAQGGRSGDDGTKGVEEREAATMW